MDAAASVITIASLALSSIHMICKTVSDFKNGPRSIQEMTSNLRSLSNLLQQLMGYRDSLYLASDLPDLVGKCAESLRWFEEKLQKLSPSKSSKAERLWKSVKLTLQERDLDRMSTLLQQHIAMLSLQINVLEGKALSSHTKSLERVEMLSNEQVALNATNSNTIERTRVGLDQIGGSIEDIKTASQASSQSMRHALEMVGEKMQDLAGSSTEQSNTLNTILELLQQHFPLKSQQKIAEDSLYDSTQTFDEVDTKKVHEVSDADFLQDALDRLCLLAKEKERTVFSTEANSIICDIKKILIFLSKAEEGDGSSGSRSRKRKMSQMDDRRDEQDAQYQHVIKRVKGLLSASHCVAVHEQVPRPWTAASFKSEFKNTSHRRSSQRGNFIVRTRRKINPVPIARQDSAENPQTSELEVMEASITFVPCAPQTTQIVITFQQRMLYEGSFLNKPILSVSALLPLDSPVFRSIESGDLNSLVKMLTLREACLTDRDSDGRSLLNYAIWFAQPVICKFLIDEGADVDFVEQSGDMSLTYSLGNSPILDCEDDPENLALTNECRRLLLEAGADPTSITEWSDGRRYSFIYRLLGVSTMESLQLLFSHGREFIETDNEIDPHLFLYHVLEFGHWSLKSVAFILGMQDVSKFHDQDLTGCLHFVIKGSSCECPEGLTNALTLLIKRGANVYARDAYGLSVSDHACSARTKWRDDSDRLDGKYNHDLRLRVLWTEALNASGYDAEDVISRSLRVEELSDTNEDVVADQAATFSSDPALYSPYDWSELKTETSSDHDTEKAVSNDILTEELPTNFENQFQDPTDIFFPDPTSSNSHSYNWPFLEEETNIWRT